MKPNTILLTLGYAVLQAAGHPGAASDFKRAVQSRDSPATDTAESCSSNQFSSIKIPGTKIYSVTASRIVNITVSGQFFGGTVGPVSACNVTFVYGHTGWNDSITTTVWLPLQGWTNRLVGAGGGGLATGQGDTGLATQILAGRAAVGTDGGHPIDPFSGAWALGPDGHINWALLQDFASVSLNEAIILGKAATTAYFGTKSFYTYWSGCSMGGRQGMAIAQRYPTAVDGILAGAPALHWLPFAQSLFWPTFVMQQLNTIPPPCVLNAITNATIKACDAQDGVQDGVLAAPDACHFDPHSLVGQQVDCGALGAAVTITANHAEVVKRIRQGARTQNGTFIWYAPEPGAPLNLGRVGQDQATVQCTGSVNNCTIAPFPPASDWIKLFLYENPKFDTSNLTHAQFDEAYAFAQAKFGDVFGYEYYDLSGFKAAGGKLVSVHGLADQLIPPQGTRDYYKRVEKLDPNVREFYRLFEAPGVQHCNGGNGPEAVDPLDAVIKWVENGTAPETLLAKTKDGAVSRPLCQFPLVAGYRGGNTSVAASFECRAKF